MSHQEINVERWEFHCADEVFIKQMVLEHRGDLVGQHAHTYDHTSMLAAGEVRVWADDECLGDFIAPTGVLIKARKMHRIQALVDGTIMYCIHNTHGHAPDELEEHLIAERNLIGEAP
jgi:hypothetical protein